MKFLAILKDSFREAIDTKVFYFTVAASALTILLVGSVSFRPLGAAEQFEYFSDLMNFVIQGQNPGGGGPRLAIADFQQTPEDGEPWQRDYRFALVVKSGGNQDLEALDRLQIGTAGQLQTALAEQFPWFNHLEVRPAPAAAGEVRFQVSTRGTNVTDRRNWPHLPVLFFGAVPLSFLQIFRPTLAGAVEFIADTLIGTFGGAVAMLLSTIITAFFIPNMLRKGSVDLLLAKPIHRGTLLVWKFLGGLTFMFLNTLLILVGLYVVLGLRTGLWLPSLLICIGVYTFQFAIFYAVSTLAAVLTRSPIVAILASVAVWAVLAVVGWGYRYIDQVRPEKVAGSPDAERLTLPGWVYPTAEVIHGVLPRYKELDGLTTRLIRQDLQAASRGRTAEDPPGHWPVSLGVTSLFIALALGLACWRFAARDY